ncbi:MAG TPA: alpha/beta fold hydrolase [Caulobacteraceae bacterium]|nr:alpha/beta fold hydrolase [Caulobacteraceae bacterium]
MALDTATADPSAPERPRRPWRLLSLGVLLIAIGSIVASLVQTAGGTRVSDVRFVAADGAVMSGLLYVPPNATAKTPAPGILAVHGYINTRETQDAFAIEFARRGYVVLALDQRGHGYSGGAATSKGFGGPDGLRYLRSLAFVDPNQIGLEGHSMGGWTVLAAAADQPAGYQAMVLEGSSTGKPFAAEGTPAWPRNLAVVESQLDEFSPLMWGVARARDVGSSPKLETLFGVTAPVTTDKIYGDAAAGTARVLYAPFATHPGDHISPEAVGYALDWFAHTLKGGTPRPAGDQVWFGKELGTLAALVGFFALLLGVFELLLGLPAFAGLTATPQPLRDRRGWRWWAVFLLTGFVPALTYFAIPLGAPLFAPSALFPQAITNSLMIWAIVNTLLALAIGWLLDGPKPPFDRRWAASIGIAVVTVAAGYLALAIVDFLFKVDFRFWVVALRPLTRTQFFAALAYLIPFTLFVMGAFRGLERLMLRGEGAAAQYLTAMVALPLGFLVLTGAQYAWLFATGALPLSFEALNTIVAIQFVPLLAVLGLISTFTWRRTGSYLPGALVAALFVTWYMVAGTATHFAA